VPDEIETHRAERIRAAFDRKCPKLFRHKTAGRETVLVLESNDIALGNHHEIGMSVAATLLGRFDVPDHIFLVETEGKSIIWTLKQGVDIYPCQRLLDVKPFEAG
jgi:hypothetical protein